MVLAIDLGNTDTTVGLWDGSRWLGVWRHPSNDVQDFPNWLDSKLAGKVVEGMIIASVVPSTTEEVARGTARFSHRPPRILRPDPRLKIEIRYEPPASLGADRLANALGARARFGSPVLVVDIGTSTTLEAVDENGVFVGGAIMPGPAMSRDALAFHTASLPRAPLEVPENAIAQSTLAAIQSGIMLGHAAAIQGLASRFLSELGDKTTAVATGGMGERFVPLCPVLEGHYPTLTLDGLIVAYPLLG